MSDKGHLSADSWTDHRLVVSGPNAASCLWEDRKVRILQRGVQYLTEKQQGCKRQFQWAREQGVYYSIEQQWEAFRDAVRTIVLEHLGLATRKNQEWFDENNEEIQALPAE